MAKVEIELPDLPEGYEYTGEYRPPGKKDYWSSLEGVVLYGTYQGEAAHIIRKLRWKPEVGQAYWLVRGFGSVGKSIWYAGSADKVYWKIGNCFPDKLSAEAAASAFKLMLKDYWEGKQ